MFDFPSIAALAVVLGGVLASAGAQAAGAAPGNTSSGNTGTRTSSNTSSNASTQTTTYSGQNRWADEAYAGREQGPEARAWLFLHPAPQKR